MIDLQSDKPSPMTRAAQHTDRVTFVTASMGTKWTAYSQALLSLHFPNWRRIVIDGFANWEPLYFTSLFKKVDSEYVVLVDEDCFILGDQQLTGLLDYMDQHPEIAITGTPDGGTFHRDYNPVACNTFFLIIRSLAVKQIEENSNWRTLQYSDVAHMADLNHLPLLDDKRTDFQKSEPYYPFFWWILKSGSKIRYLVPTVEPKTLSSAFATHDQQTPLFLHMWWLREWYSEQVDPYLKVSNLSRYQALKAHFLEPEFSKLRARGILLRLQFSNGQRRMRRLLSRRH